MINGKTSQLDLGMKGCWELDNNRLFERVKGYTLKAMTLRIRFGCIISIGNLATSMLETKVPWQQYVLCNI